MTGGVGGLRRQTQRERRIAGNEFEPLGLPDARPGSHAIADAAIAIDGKPSIGVGLADQPSAGFTGIYRRHDDVEACQ